jgi:hypothetical protein
MKVTGRLILGARIPVRLDRACLRGVRAPRTLAQGGRLAQSPTNAAMIEKAKKSEKISRMCAPPNQRSLSVFMFERYQQAAEGDVLSVTKMWF